MIKRIENGVWIKEDGKEVCLRTREGRREYDLRLEAMDERQGHRCAMCGKFMFLPTFDHENGRGAGKQDDRIEVDGRWQNAALHLHCNQQKGSKRTTYLITQDRAAQ